VAEIRRIMVQNQPRHGSGDPISKKPNITKKKKKGLVEWLKVKTLSSNPNTQNPKRKNLLRNCSTNANLTPQLREKKMYTHQGTTYVTCGNIHDYYLLSQI
jgi:hypothetical protein